MRSNRSSADPSDRWFYVAPQQQPSAFSQPSIFPQPQHNFYYPLPHDSVYATAAAPSQSSPFLASSSAAQFPIPQWSQPQYPLTSSLASVAMALPHSAVDARFLSAMHAMQMQAVPAPLQHMQTSLSDLSLINPLTAQRQLTPTVYRRRASVSRSRTGCWQCRVRRKKCDDRKPKCLTCERLDICCMYGPCPENMRTVEDRRRAARELTVQIRAAVKRRSAERAARNSKAAAAATIAAAAAPAPAALPAPPSGLEVSVAMMREPLAEPSTALVSTDPKLTSSGYQLLPDIGPGSTAREEADRVPISPPAFFAVEIQTLDFDSPLSPLRVLQEYVDQIPRSIYSSHTDAARQLAYVVVYFRMAARILFPGLFLQTDDLIDCQTLVYSIAVQDAWVWRSICAIGSVFASMAASGVLAVDDVDFLTSGSTAFIEEANALMSEYPARNEGGTA
ncbi:hypothetical protein BZA70DRAFT_59931 [Myxozyma melibiosi]|uniref:Zn(2)-C6 fungal-type domain-containing protein n=1 Tax=Myxozyma melibiosi TaxID=54550 RepID=A0ABR1F1U7_9ASCO